MVKQKEYKKKVEEQIEKISSQIQELRYQVVEAPLKDEFERLIRELEEIRDRIKTEYEEMEESGEERWDQVDKNIYQDLEAFRSSFKKAGSMFKPKRESPRERTGSVVKPKKGGAG